MPKKILLADDSITIQKVVELTFSDGDYEVTAVNNGARAIQKLGEMRPDIILSDIIMPEKNGYEVCEYVKSHPEYRNIPVVLLTGTFEPFDPDRADKAGCDAVVTKPFESQSLIHKVEELIEQSRAAAPAASAPPAAAAPAGFDFDSPPQAEETPQAASPWADEPASSPNASDIFGAAPPVSDRTTEMPFESSPEPSGGETRAFPPMSFGNEDNPATTQQFTPPTEPSSPWDQPQTGGEKRAFPKMSFEDMQRMAGERTEEQTPPAQDDSPFGAPPPAEEFSGETRAFPKMNFNDLPTGSGPAAPSAPADEPRAAEESPWGGGGGETRAFPAMSFDQPAETPEESPAAEAAPAWSDAQEPSAPDWSSTPEPPAEEEPAPSPFSIPEPAPFEAAPEAEAEESQEAQAPAWAAPAAVAATSAESGNGVGGELSDEQVDRIARRVVQLMSDQVVRNIAWEVIPDMAEMVVKERIRQLESET